MMKRFIPLLICFTSIAFGAETVNFPLTLKEKGSDESRLVMKSILDASIDSETNQKHEKDVGERLKKVTQAAFNWGVKEGQYYFNKINQNQLNNYDSKLQVLANFAQFIVDGKLLLPKVVINERLFQRINDSKVRTTGFSYSLFEPAKIITQPPTWRDYLSIALQKPSKPSALFLPRSKQEESVFRYEFERGWEYGREQASIIFDENYKRLERDLKLHFNFLDLAMTNVLRMPSLRSTDPTVVVSSDGKTLYGNDVFYSIDQQSTFEKLDKWKPVFIEGAR
ncbi:type IV secretory system conjugative DNA transfer family protein [Salinimonas chungwhensis]|uniref:type IV secretory system conjugative DNA transfer family protein n=1 Tax=Salinimonas chungwhensis TaxID=265425 RepID=UPI00036C130F|nr:type IV secretory system conjugative DNA transfer family protein [Salinimonas chungwhensis]